jgi:hypothetical protein
MGWPLPPHFGMHLRETKARSRNAGLPRIAAAISNPRISVRRSSVITQANLSRRRTSAISLRVAAERARVWRASSTQRRQGQTSKTPSNQR